MTISSPWLRSLPFSRLFRQLEHEMETVVTVLQPGPLGIVEHKFSAEEIRKANATVQRAVQKWQQNAILEKRSRILEEYIQK
ncbi:uncharacterized protein LOC133739515 isoform X2 [Rosa rugosa]|uniref:Uncharacterized protein n=1 Tax=Rosa chinensis TaxID=74649 RepID=A0A2P6PWK0_ROSCH|nr:uncharacterized protein LOC112172929 [Rosa chinensis]XP_040365025.1 uncharacterized protein LOC112172929 [Rosa chinensis]XP_062023284.1 uncharacterized protein LOC133739515 isoform X2 [Rosa rugosa]PRQ26286.1 hypothetical protein RchiOBHm_Chr6g0292931 [Rosa chinensis]